MVALDNTAFFGSAVPRFRVTLAPLVGAIALLAVGLVFGVIAARGFSENGFRLGSQVSWRYAAIAFFVALVSGPVCRIAARLFHTGCPESLSRKLIWGFCASYGVYLLSVFLPNAIDMSAGATMMVLFGGGVTVVMALTAAPLKVGDRVLIAQRVRRVLLGGAAIYFWLSYALMALSRLAGPHRPDAWYGISLTLMVLALLVRFADRWSGPRKAVPASVQI